MNESPKASFSYERATRMANRGVWAVQLQSRRLVTAEPEDENFALRRWVDFDFLVVAASRVRRAAVVVQRIPEFEGRMSLALRQFDQTLPGLKRMRDVAEHFDAYAHDKGNEKTVTRRHLEVSRLGADASGATLEWLDEELNSTAILRACVTLFEAIKSVRPGRSVDAGI